MAEHDFGVAYSDINALLRTKTGNDEIDIQAILDGHIPDAWLEAFIAATKAVLDLSKEVCTIDVNSDGYEAAKLKLDDSIQRLVGMIKTIQDPQRLSDTNIQALIDHLEERNNRHRERIHALHQDSEDSLEELEAFQSSVDEEETPAEAPPAPTFAPADTWTIPEGILNGEFNPGNLKSETDDNADDELFEIAQPRNIVMQIIAKLWEMLINFFDMIKHWLFGKQAPAQKDLEEFLEPIPIDFSRCKNADDFGRRDDHDPDRGPRRLGNLVHQRMARYRQMMSSANQYTDTKSGSVPGQTVGF